MSGIVVESLYKIYGKRADKALELLDAGRDDAVADMAVTAAVIDATFEVKPGEIFVVMGLSGSGKSTLIRMLNGLLTPSRGTVKIDGVDLTRLKPAALRKLRREKISMVFQHFALLPHRTVADNAGYALEVAGLPRAERRERAAEALRLVGLDGWGEKLPQELSGGMRQRVGLARALAAGTDVMLMDEAFSALDPLIRREVQDQLLELQAQLGKTIVFITHDLNEAMRLGDRIAVMRAGRIVQIGTAEEILTEPSSDYVARFVADVDRTRILTASSVMARPLGVVDVNSGPRVAGLALRDAQTAAVYVTGRDKRFIGTVTADVIKQAVRDGRQNLQGIVSTEDAWTVPEDAPVASLFAACAASPHPLAVLDTKERLVGVIPRITLLTAMGDVTSELPEVAAAPQAGEPAAADPATVESAAADPASGSAGHGEPVPADPLAAGPPTAEPPTAEPPTADPPIRTEGVPG